jgi:hypothetical protein
MLRLARDHEELLRDHGIDPEEVEEIELRTDSKLYVRLQPKTRLIDVKIVSADS